jgi:UDP-N-acetylglucosamine--N-acetylmuramyl-(pentapeptide) pyrophosphoryl-undecaprenol N-acetylglucosamine transferase
MKILLTGGGSGGHFYPLIAIAEEINRIVAEEKLLRPELYYMSTAPYDEKLLSDNEITFKIVFAGKSRLYFSLWNIFDIFTLFVGTLKALWSMYFLYPDVVISKGGYASLPAVFATWFLRIPLIIHESDTVPGRTNKLSMRRAFRIAVSWPEAAKYFPKEKTAVTGQPILRELLHPVSKGAKEYLGLREDVPILLVTGGSQGAQKINDALLNALPKLLEHYQVIHQTGRKNKKNTDNIAKVILENHPHKDRYHTFGFMDALSLRMAAGTSSLVIARGGSNIFEIAAWGLPSIIIPITDTHGDHQRKNAFTYARTGACVVIGEQNLSSNVLYAEILRLMEDEKLRVQMGNDAIKFFKTGAAEEIAREALRVSLEHEK